MPVSSALVLIIVAVAFFAGVVVVFTTFAEAERRLGRDLGICECILIAMSMPYSGAFIWLALPDKSQDGGGDA